MYSIYHFCSVLRPHNNPLRWAVPPPPHYKDEETEAWRGGMGCIIVRTTVSAARGAASLPTRVLALCFLGTLPATDLGLCASERYFCCFLEAYGVRGGKCEKRRPKNSLIWYRPLVYSKHFTFILPHLITSIILCHKQGSLTS